jgi:hypothetical protein
MNFGDLHMWECTKEIVEVSSNIIQSAVALFGAWIAWKTFVKEEQQDNEVALKALQNTENELKFYETRVQTTCLRKTESGIECYLDDKRSGKTSRVRWIMPAEMANRIASSGDVYVEPGLNLKTGRVSIGMHTNWLYSKSLYPDGAVLHHKIIEFLRTKNS